MATTRTGEVTLKGNPIKLVGAALKAGDAAPDFTLQSTGMEDVQLNTYTGKTRVIATIPSLDTPVCDTETRHFNEQVAALPNTEILVVSMDLPFGQKRWCGAAGVDKVHTLSAHRCTQFGSDYGVLIEGGPLDRCLARAVFVVSPDGKLAHVEYVKEIAEQPDYDAALGAART